ncbi:MAG: hypothetical protein HUK20_13710 [Fibrobacter sp.]|nr:hypothetical protein [Fibrobacter sp.]
MKTEQTTPTGIVKEKYRIVGAEKVMEVINKHPDYELYEKYGFASNENITNFEGIKNLCNKSCCLNIEVIDNEIHVNGFAPDDTF